MAERARPIFVESSEKGEESLLSSEEGDALDLTIDLSSTNMPPFPLVGKACSSELVSGTGHTHSRACLLQSLQVGLCSLHFLRLRRHVKHPVLVLNLGAGLRVAAMDSSNAAADNCPGKSNRVLSSTTSVHKLHAAVAVELMNFIEVSG